MIKYILLFTLPLLLSASKILSYNIYDRSDRADVMITFDTPYEGVIKQSIGKNRIVIKLTDASIESSKLKRVNSEFLHSLTITPLQDQVQIFANTSENVRLIASKTADAYGLRLRFTKKVTQKKSPERTQTPNLSALPTKQSTEISTSYYIVVGLLIAAIVLLLLFKKKIIASRGNKPPVASKWLFQTEQTNPVEETKKQSSEESINIIPDTVSIKFQKILDKNNRVIFLEFGTSGYLILLGENSTKLLDKFSKNPSTDAEFDTILQAKNHVLADFLASPQESQPESHKEPLQAYKERAASLIYSDEA